MTPKGESTEDFYERQLHDLRARIRGNGNKVSDAEFKDFVLLSLDVQHESIKTFRKLIARVDNLEDKSGGYTGVSKLAIDYWLVFWPSIGAAVSFLSLFYIKDARDLLVDFFNWPAELFSMGLTVSALLGFMIFTFTAVINGFRYLRLEMARQREKG